LVLLALATAGATAGSISAATLALAQSRGYSEARYSDPDRPAIDRDRLDRQSSDNPRYAADESASRSDRSWSPRFWPRWTSRTDRDDPERRRNRRHERDATGDLMSPRNMLRQAETDMAAGRTEMGYQGLEKLIERHPHTPEADLAKDRLVEHFRTARQTQSARQQTVERAAPEAAPLPAALQPPIRVVPPAIVPPPPRPVAQPAPAVQPLHPQDSPAPKAASLRRGGDDFKQSVGDRIFFDTATARIDSRQRSVLQAQAAWLKERPETVVKLEGHADEPGTRELNFLVARERAEAVRSVLIKEGVAAERIEITAVGNDQPVARCAAAAGVPTSPIADACAGQNRRVVTVVEWAGAEPRRRLSIGAGAPPATESGATPPTPGGLKPSATIQASHVPAR
jgi:peptidoglycan-associated lipoprotein